MRLAELQQRGGRAGAGVGVAVAADLLYRVRARLGVLLPFSCVSPVSPMPCSNASPRTSSMSRWESPRGPAKSSPMLWTKPHHLSLLCLDLGREVDRITKTGGGAAWGAKSKRGLFSPCFQGEAVTHMGFHNRRHRVIFQELCSLKYKSRFGNIYRGVWMRSTSACTNNVSGSRSGEGVLLVL